MSIEDSPGKAGLQPESGQTAGGLRRAEAVKFSLDGKVTVFAQQGHTTLSGRPRTQASERNLSDQARQWVAEARTRHGKGSG